MCGWDLTRGLQGSLWNKPETQQRPVDSGLTLAMVKAAQWLLRGVLEDTWRNSKEKLVDLMLAGYHGWGGGGWVGVGRGGRGIYI